MTYTDTQRRMTILRSTPLFSDTIVFPDDYVFTVLESSALKWLNLTHQSGDLGDEIDDMVIELAKIKLGREGVEGTSGSSDADISRSWDVLPPDLYNQIRGYRMAIGMASRPKKDDKKDTRIVLKDLSPMWVPDSTHAGFMFCGEIVMTGYTRAYSPEILLSEVQAFSGLYSQFAVMDGDIIKFWSNSNTNIVIPKVILSDFGQTILSEGSVNSVPPQSGGSEPLIYRQDTEEMVWKIEHNFGREVIVETYNSVGEREEGSLTMSPDNNYVYIEFAKPMKGTAVII